MNFKKRVNGSWTDTSHYIHNTSTDIITTLPAVIYPTGTTATVGLKGQAVQSGTPTPDNPIMPQGTGERSINLTPNQKITSSSYSYTVATHPLIDALKNITPNDNYTLSWEFSSNGSGGVSNQIRLYTSAQGTLIKILKPEVSFTLTSEEIANLGALFCYFGTGNTDGYMDEFMLVEGSTALPYEPYGFKIPISSADTTTPVYLGEVESTRQIKKLVLTGTNADGEWKKSSTRIGSFYLTIGTNATIALGLCDRAVNVGTIEQYNSIGKMFVEASGPSKLINLWLFDTNISLDDFKSYLAAQYAAGTPVTVWYVLETPKTAVVNEPLRKIGDYADEVSGITIPTIAGADSFDVLTTLKPSEVELTYTGWHDATVKEWDGSEWQ